MVYYGMNKQELLEALEACGMRPGRGLGQNFLLDANLLECIVRSAGVTPGMNVLEVGPGFGAVGPAGSYAWMSAPAKVLLSFAMILGRLEIYTLLVVFMPSFWKR